MLRTLKLKKLPNRKLKQNNINIKKPLFKTEAFLHKILQKTIDKYQKSSILCIVVNIYGYRYL